MTSAHMRLTRGVARFFSAGVLAATLSVAAMAQPALAAEPSTISYDSSARQLTVTDAYDNADTPNLFMQFADIMPGDTLTQEIDVTLSDISASTRLYIRALTDESQLSEDAQKALSQMRLKVEFTDVTGAPATVAPATEEPQNVFASDEPVLVATVSADASFTMKLMLEVPTSIGNEMNDLEDVSIPWVIKVEDEAHSGGGDPGGDSSDVELVSIDLTAYEGGLGSSSTAGRTDNLPEPEWGIDWENAEVKVDGEDWDVAEQGLPFKWSYGTTTADGFVPVSSTGALVGTYHLQVEPLEDVDSVTVDGKLLSFPEDGIVTYEDGSDVMVSVRDVTNDTAADELDPDYFKPVYGSASFSLQGLFDGVFPSTKSAAAGLLGSALDGDFNAAGTHDGSCDVTEPHAHVGAGTTFLKNGQAGAEVKDGARIGLLWDDFIPGVLGDPDREGVLDAKALAAVGWQDEEGVSNRFKYLDLVDMNDGNVWVATADGSSTTVFVPYFDGISAEEEIAVAYFDGLTRDYTVDMDAANLDQEILSSDAHALKVTKTSDGILFDVPCAEFGPFDLLWKDADGEEPGTDEPGGPDEPGPDEPGPDEPGPDEPGPDEPGGPDGPDTPGEPSGPGDADTPAADDQTDRPHTELVADTGDHLPTAMPLIAAAGAALVALAALLFRRRRREE